MRKIIFITRLALGLLIVLGMTPAVMAGQSEAQKKASAEKKAAEEEKAKLELASKAKIKKEKEDKEREERVREYEKKYPVSKKTVIKQ